MISNRPYIIRAMYDWIVDNGWTPHMQVDSNYPGVNVPMEYVQDGVIVLNVSSSAVMGLTMENDCFSFKARFKGVETTVRFPPESILAIFARENGQGMPFPAEPYPEDYEDKELEEAKKPSLSTVEGGKESGEAKTSKTAAKSNKKSSTAKKPTLTVIK